MITGARVEMSTSSLGPGSRILSGNSSGATVCANLRHTLWSAIVRELNAAKLPYCVLGASAQAVDAGDSDIDFAVSPRDYPHISQLLASAAAQVGGQLVQAIEHETTATYFVLARREGKVVAFLHPDCTTEYRRQGRLWMSSEELLRGRRRAPAGYFRPAPDVELKYYLIKQVLKQTPSDAQWRKLVALYKASPLRQNALSMWSRSMAAQIERAILNDDCAGFRDLLPRCNHQLNRTSLQEGRLGRGGSLVLDCARVAARIVHPTGLFVHISNGSAEERSELAGMLANTLAPAFRRAFVLTFSNPAEIVRALIASTLVVSTNEMLPFHPLYGGVNVRWQPGLTSAENLESVVAIVLTHLAQRTMRRLELQSDRTQRLGTETAARTVVS